MNTKEYTEKLKRFNATKEYEKEMEFFKKIIEPETHESILDFGCGLGKMTEYVNKFADVKGYDCTNYFKKKPQWFYTEILGFYQKIYFMHSIAHIFALEENLKNLPLLNGGKVYVFTPNLMWLSSMNTEDYLPDVTVVRHFTAEGLKGRFESLGFEILIQGGYGEVRNNYHERLFLIAQL